MRRTKAGYLNGLGPVLEPVGWLDAEVGRVLLEFSSEGASFILEFVEHGGDFLGGSLSVPRKPINFRLSPQG